MIVREEEGLAFWVRTTPLQWNRIAPGDRFRRPPPPPSCRTSPSHIPSSPAGAPRKQSPPGLQVSSGQLDHAVGAEQRPATKTSAGLIPLSPFLFRRPRRIG